MTILNRPIYHFQTFLACNFWFLGVISDPLTYPKLGRYLWTFPKWQISVHFVVFCASYGTERLFSLFLLKNTLRSLKILRNCHELFLHFYIFTRFFLCLFFLRKKLLHVPWNWWVRWIKIGCGSGISERAVWRVCDAFINF